MDPLLRSPALALRGDDAELLQEPERVPHLPRFGDLALRHAVDRDRRDVLDRLPGGGHAVDVADVLAGTGPADDDLVAGREDVVDVPVAVEADLVGSDRLGHAFRPLPRLDLRVVKDV